jgi:5-methylcytosine-specific restriction endonuclease McrA
MGLLNNLYSNDLHGEYMPYEDQLNHPNWISKRKQILERDDFKCKKCKSEHNLNVHHVWYIPGRKAWEYFPSFLTTLCDKCHRKEHNIPDQDETDPIMKSAGIIQSALQGLKGLSRG